MATDNVVIGFNEAANLCGCSRASIERKKDQLAAAGAYKTEGQWHIPVPVLIEVGLLKDTPRKQTEADASQTHQRRVIDLEHENALLRAEVDKWRALAEERLTSLNIERQMFLLPVPKTFVEPQAPNPSIEPVEVSHPAPTQAPEQPQARTWAGRMRSRVKRNITPET